MEKKSPGNNITKNMFLVLLSQFFSISVSFVLGFIVPKFIDEYQYAYWQTFLLYYGYASLFNFGLVDGFVLRYSQYNFDELPKVQVKEFFQTLLAWTSIVSFLVVTFALFYADGNYRTVFILVGVGVLIRHLWVFNYTLFNTTNRLSLYSKYVVVQRLVYLIAVIFILLFRINNFVYLCAAELLGELSAFFLSVRFNKGLYFSREKHNLTDALSELRLNIFGGFFLLVANFSSNFLLSGAKTIIQIRWDELVFGKVSFSFSVSNLFLTLFTTISVVLFPSIKRMREDTLPSLYVHIRNIVTPLMFFCLLVFFPLSIILKAWLPSYSSSLRYLGILLPIIIYTSILNLLTNNYFKAYRKEKNMFIINMATLTTGMLLYAVFAFVLNQLELLLYTVVIVSTVRFYVSEIVVLKIIKQKPSFTIVLEIIVATWFIVCVGLKSFILGGALYLAAFVIYFAFTYRNLKAGFFSLRKR